MTNDIKDRIEPVLGISPVLEYEDSEQKLRGYTGCLQIKTSVVTDYKVVQGLPAAVELEVKMLLMTGWRLNGELHSIKTPLDNHNGIVVQCMII